MHLKNNQLHNCSDGRLCLTDVVWPFEFYGQVLVSSIVRLNALYDGNCCQVLDKNDRSRIAKLHRMFHAYREDQ